MKQPYFPFYVGDWLKDTKLSLCCPATRGVWMDLICGLHEIGHGGTITANAQQLARLCRCSVSDMESALNELRTYDVAELYEKEGRYTVICRRMKRAAELTAKRQQAGSKAHSKDRARPEYDNEDEVRKEIEEFCTSIELPKSDGTACYHKWQGNGWTNNGKPIRDWRATIRAWKDYRYLPSQKATNGQQKPKFLSFQDRKKRREEIQNQLNSQFKRKGDRTFTDEEEQEREKLRIEMDNL